MAETALPAISDRTRFVGIAAAIGAISAVGTSLSLGLPLLSLVLENRGTSASATGINTAFAGIAALAVTPFVPRIAQHFGAAQTLLAALAISTVTFPLFYVFESYGSWLLLRFVFHGAVTAAFILSEFWINALAPPGKRGLLLGVYATVLSLGFAVGPAILGLVGSAGFLPFALGTAVLALSLLPVLFALGANPAMPEKPSGRFIRYLFLVPLGTFAGLTFGATDSGILTFIAVYGLRVGLEQASAALLVSALAVGNIVSQIPLGLLADRMDRRILLLIVTVVAMASMMLLPVVSHSPILLLCTMAVFGGVVAGLYTVGLVHIGARLEGSDLAAANAGFVFMYGLGMLIGPAAVGAGMDWWNPHGLAVVTTVMLGAYAVLAIVRIRTATTP